MRSATMKIKNKYFGYTFTKILPALLLMTLVMLLVSFCFFMFSNFSTSNGITLVSAEMMSISTYPFAFIYPTILSILLFPFLHKKQSADFFGGAPITRGQMFLSNTAIAAISFFTMILLNGAFVLTTIFVARPGIAAVLAFGEIIRYLVINFVAFMTAYAASALAASLTGSSQAQFVLAYIIMIIPSLLVNMVQTLSVIDGGNMTLIYPVYNDYSPLSSFAYPSDMLAVDFNKIFIIPNILSAPFTLLTEVFTSDFFDFYGSIGYFTNISAMIHNAILACAYTVGGYFIFKKYKLENAGTPFCSKWVFFAAKASLFATFFALVFRLITAFSWDVIIIILFIMAFVAYVILDIIIKKGIRDIGRSLAVFAISVAVGFGIGAMSLGANVLMRDHLNKLDITDTDEIKSCTIYLPPFNASSDTDIYGIKGTYVPVTTSDADIISGLFTKNFPDTRSYFCTLKLENGNTITANLSVSGAGCSALLKAIAEDETLYTSLFKAPGKRNIEATYIVSNSKTSYHLSPVKIGKYTTADIMTEEFDAFNAASPEQRAEILIGKYSHYLDYGYVTDPYRSYGYDFSDVESVYVIKQYGRDEEMFIDNTDSLFTSCVVKYIDGKYYTETVSVPNDEKYYPILEKLAATKKDIKALNTRSEIFVSFIGAIDIDNEQPVFMVDQITDMASVAPDIFREMALKAADSPIIYENTLCFYIGKINKVLYLNVDRDIMPALEKYADRIFDIVKYQDTNAESYSIILDEHLIWTSYEKLIYTSDGEYYSETDIDKRTRLAIPADEETIKKCMTRKYDKNNMEYPMYLCSVLLTNNYYIRGYVQLVFDADCTEMMKNIDSLLNKSTYRYEELKKAEKINIYGITDFLISVTEREDIDKLAFIASLQSYGEFSAYQNYTEVEFCYPLSEKEIIAGIDNSEREWIPVPAEIIEKYLYPQITD